jgi:ABC-2 type transport system permease protein
MLVYAVENVAAQPLRLVAAIPMAAIGLWAVGGAMLPRSAALWAVWCAALAGGWLITFLVNFAVGSLSFYVESSTKVMEAWLVLFFVLSGYMIPVELFPPLVRGIVDVLPFRYQIGFPVEVMTGAHDLRAALVLLARQGAWVVVLFSISLALWRGGLRRFAAYGG